MSTLSLSIGGFNPCFKAIIDKWGVTIAILLLVFCLFCSSFVPLFLLSSFITIFIVIWFEYSLFCLCFFFMIEDLHKISCSYRLLFYVDKKLSFNHFKKKHHTFLLPSRLCFCYCVHTILFIVCVHRFLLLLKCCWSFLLQFSCHSLYSSAPAFLFLSSFFYDFYFFLKIFLWFLFQKLLILCICCFPDFVELSLCSLVAYWVYKNNYSDSLELRKYLLPLVCAISLIFCVSVSLMLLSVHLREREPF